MTVNSLRVHAGAVPPFGAAGFGGDATIEVTEAFALRYAGGPV